MDERAAAAASAPTTPHEPVTTPPAAAGATEQPAAPKRRRRGSRGGRGRKKPAGAATAPAKPEETKAEPPKKDAARPERRPAARKQRTRTRRTPPRRPPLPPAKRELMIPVDISEQRVAVLEDGKVAEAYLERPERRSIAGNIYKGTVDNVLPGMEAAFIEIGLEKNGFLYVDEVVVPELEGRSHGRKIQDLLSRGQDVLVQAVKDPMKSKGARLTTEISLPGRFVVYVPQGEGIGVSRRLEDDERIRLRDILKRLELPKGGVIVRTAAEGASAEDIERDVRFLEKIWKEIQASAKKAPVPSLVYHEAELPLRVVRDLFAGDFERALIDDDLTYKRIVGYLKKTSPHMAERVVRYREKEPLFEAFGVDAEIKPLGLVEMPRQNVTDGPREILTKRCPTCAGDGIVVSEASTAVEAERRLRALAAQSPRTKAFKVELNPHVASILIGPGAERLKEIETATKRVFLLEGKEGTPLDHFTVLDKGTLEKLSPESSYKEGQEIDVKLGEVGLHDSNAGMAKVDGFEVCVGDAARLVGKKVKARVERVMDGT